MTRKHFITIAEILKTTKATKETINRMAQMCAVENPRFDIDRFLEASGYTE